MTSSSDFPSGWSTGKKGTDRTLVNLPESIGAPADAPATGIDAVSAAFALLKGIAADLGVPPGDGTANTNPVPHRRIEPLATLGSVDDAPATDAADAASAIAFLKGIAQQLGVPS